ncbi:MAG TPA: sensor histidine kinase [Nitrospirae bacterium]|nr:sensor histidine kinase [Nitrospirota bacterium]
MGDLKDITGLLKEKYRIVRSDFELADAGFLVLRIIALIGGYGWLIFADIPSSVAERFSYILVYFIIYCLFLYALLFWLFKKKQVIYVFSLFLDLSFLYLLITNTGGFNSSYFVGFYLLTVLHSFYFGYKFGIFVATLSTIVYALAGRASFESIHWTELSLRISFLYLLAIPVGILSDRLRYDKERIETLNRELLRSMEEAKKLQNKLIQSEKLSALGKMTADVAHEIRNPLSAIGGFAKRLKKRLSSGTKEMDYAEIIVEEVGRLERILKDVLNFSREARYHLRYTNINNVVRDSVKYFQDMMKERSIVLEEELADELPEILVDRDQVIQVFNNLITNAIDAMPEGGTLTISTRTDTEHNVSFVVVDIVDTGHGIPEEKIDRVFEPFFTTKEIGHGTGLGLSICKKIMDEHRGRIKVCSIKGTGTSFSLYFPYVPAEETFKTQCWEYMKCGVEKTEGAIERRCPSYPNYGRICWVIAGTYCEGRVQGAIAQKIGDCKKCEFYNRVVLRKDL